MTMSLGENNSSSENSCYKESGENGHCNNAFTFKTAFTIDDVLDKSFLACCRCKEYCVDPKLLPCLHTLCSECEESCDSCPSCTIKQLENSTSNGKSNVFIAGLQKLADCRNKEEQFCDYCRYEGKPTVPAIYRCLECADNMCDECSDAHKKTKLTRNHTMLTYKEIRRGEHDETFRARVRLPCLKHNEELMTKYCSTCQQLICRECREKTHESHNVSNIDDACKKVEQQIDKQLISVKDRIPRVERYIDYLESYRSSLKEKEEFIHQKIEEKAEEVQKLLESYKLRIQEDLRCTVDRERSHIESLAQNLRDIESGLIESCEFVSALIQIGRPHEVLSLHSTVRERLSQLLQISLKGITCKLGMEFQEGNTAESNIELILGRVNIGQTNLGTSDPQLPNQKPPSTAPSSVSKLNLSVLTNNRGPSPSNSGSPSPNSMTNDVVHNNGNPPANPNQRNQPQYSSRSVYSMSTDILISSRMGTTPAALQNLLEPPAPPTPPKQSTYVPKPANTLPPLLPKAELVLEFDARSHTDSHDIWPTGLAINSANGDMFILDRDNKSVKVFDPQGKYKFEFGGATSTGDAKLSSPYDLAISQTGLIYVTDYQCEEINALSWNTCIKLYDLRGNFTRAFDCGFKHPRGIAVTSQGHFVVADCRLRQVSVHESDRGKPLLVIRGVSMGETELFTDPYYVHVTVDNCILVTDWSAPSLKIFDNEGNIITQTGYYGTGPEQLLQPCGISSDRNGYIMIADNSNHRIHVAAPDGKFMRYMATKSDGLWHPMALAIDSNRGRLVVTEALGKVKVFKYISS